MTYASLLEFLEATSIAVVIDQTRWAPMAVQIVHVIGFTLLLAVIVAFTLRAQRAVLTSVPLAQLANALRPYYVLALWLTVAGGILLFLPRAVAYAANDAFVAKLVLMVLAIGLQYALLRRARQIPEGQEFSFASRMLVAATTALWFAAGAAGRAIGFSA